MPEREDEICPFKNECNSHYDRGRDDLRIFGFVLIATITPQLEPKGPVGHWVAIRNEEPLSVDFWRIILGNTFE